LPHLDGCIKNLVEELDCSLPSLVESTNSPRRKSIVPAHFSPDDSVPRGEQFRVLQSVHHGIEGARAELVPVACQLLDQLEVVDRLSTGAIQDMGLHKAQEEIV